MHHNKRILIVKQEEEICKVKTTMHKKNSKMKEMLPFKLNQIKKIKNNWKIHKYQKDKFQRIKIKVKIED